MDGQVVWVDAARCTGCGACVEVCPVEAIALLEGRARVDEGLCNGCGACAGACPEDAIQPVVTVQGELIAAPERPPPTIYRPSPIVKTAGAAVAVAGTGLLMRAVRALARVVGRWLMRGLAGTGPSASRGTAPTRDGGGTGRQRRHRRRGR
jgi:Fe-S-cluster-containing hydrogenase component 2